MQLLCSGVAACWLVLLRQTGEDQKVLASINPKFLLLFFALKAH